MHITLFVPGAAAFCAERALQRRLPALETLLVHAQVQPAPGGDAILAGIFGLTAAEFAAAPFMRLADTGRRDDGFYFCADPVHLAADRDQLVMLPLSVLQVQQDEAHALAETFNRTFEAEGYRLETPRPERWYLRFPAPVSCITHNPAELIGQPVFEFMPQGEDGQQLRQFMNATQMLFYEHPVNQAREAAGKVAINSLWLWGGGCLPERSIKDPGKVLTDMPLITGLARFADSNCSGWAGKLEITTEPAQQLMAIHCTTDAELLELEEHITVPLLHALRHGRLSELLLYPGNQRGYRVTPASLRRFWRRRRPLSEILRAP